MLSLNGITNYGDVHADTLNVKNAAGTGWDDVKTLIAAAGGGGGLTNAQVTALINAALTAYTNTVGLNTLLAAYTNTTGLNTLLAAYTNTAGLTTLLAGKQATLTSPGAGVFLNGTTLSGYGLRWNASAVPTGIIEELHWMNYTVNQTVNFGTGKVELTIGHPTDMATQTWAQQKLAGVSQTGTGATAKLKSTSAAFQIGDSTNAADIIMKGSNGGTTTIFSNHVFVGIIPQANSKLRLYSANHGHALEVDNASTNIVHYGTFGAASDRRLKDDIQDADAEDCQRILDQVNVKTYTRKDHKTGDHRLGYIAQDVQAALPPDGKFQNLITTFTHGEGDDATDMLGVDYSRMTCVLWTCVQALLKRVEALEQAQTKKKTVKSKA